jgi:hypothetical protein
VFTELSKFTALAIVRIFETGKPFGDYSAVAVLDDGAGISYGISQFTHKSGALEDVLSRFKRLGGVLPSAIAIVFESIEFPNRNSIAGLSKNAAVKKELKELGKDPLMQQAQREISFEKYLRPAIEACEGSGFALPLSLAVIYDSMNHGSYGRIRDRVTVDRSSFTSEEVFEKAWVADYCRERLDWLGASHGDLKNTVYRPQTFLDLIRADNWTLDLPINVRLGAGKVRLSSKIFESSAATPAEKPTNNSGDSAADPSESSPPETPSEIGPPPPTSTETVIVRSTENSEGKTVSTAKSETFTPETITQYIPKITAAKRWLGGFSILGMFATVGGWFAGLPDWLVFLLGFLTGVAITCLTMVFIRYKRSIFDLVKQVIAINSDPKTNNIVLETEK